MSVTTFSISKDVYFKSISSGFKDKIGLVNAVKLDYPRMDVIVNNKKYCEYYEFLEYVKRDYPEYLTKILLLTNQNAHFYYYNKIFDILSKYDFHFVSDDDKNQKDKYLKTQFVLNPIVKQASLFNKYNVISITDNGEKIHRTLYIKTIVDLVILDPITIVITYKD
tara:strand:+ start:319 stop:816 length:498 start_codon:yes stop_codon:yes gene_type:complete